MPAPADRAARTVGQVAAELGVTVRTLHHWDEIGLASPSLRSPAGYRLYAAGDIERLRRVLVHRELGLGLNEVHTVLDDPTVDPVELLRSQRAQLADRIAHLEVLRGDLDRMISAHEHGVTLPTDEQAAVFGAGWDPAWPARARARWGDTATWRQYAERSAGRDAEDWRSAAAASDTFDRTLARAVEDGVVPGSATADALVEEHRDVFSAWFPLSRQMQVLLARRYAAEPGFRAHYEALRPGLADWFRSIVEASARRHGIDPDTAVWE